MYPKWGRGGRRPPDEAIEDSTAMFAAEAVLEELKRARASDWGKLKFEAVEVPEGLEPHLEEHPALARALSRGAAPKLGIMLNLQLFQSLERGIASWVFWKELDDATMYVRSVAHEGLRHSARSVLRNLHDPPLVAPVLRRCIELALWAGVFQAGVLAACNTLHTAANSRRKTAFFSADADRYVRSAIAIDPVRVAHGARVLDAGAEANAPDGIPEARPSTEKLRGISEFLALNGDASTSDLDRLVDGFEYLNGFVHVTPLAFHGWRPNPWEPPGQPPFEDLALRLLEDSASFVERFCTGPKFDDATFLGVLRPHLPAQGRPATDVVEVELEMLRRFITGGKAVVLPTDDGGEMRIDKPRRR